MQKYTINAQIMFSMQLIRVVCKNASFLWYQQKAKDPPIVYRLDRIVEERCTKESELGAGPVCQS
jgi:hypothetical protein